MKFIKFIFLLFCIIFVLYVINDIFIKNIDINVFYKRSPFNELISKTFYNIDDIDYLDDSILLVQGFKNDFINEVIDNSYDNDYLYYLYNTHQGELYTSSDLVYSVEPSVLTVNYMIEEELKKFNINALVENRNVTQILKERNYPYNYSYRITNEFLLEIKKKHESILCYIDIHRDSGNKNATTTTIEGKEYAKIMFVVAKDSSTYDSNIAIVKKLENYVNSKYFGLVRNTYYQEEGDYNQSMSDCCLLIEVGGVYNTLEELYNTSFVISDMLIYLKGMIK